MSSSSSFRCRSKRFRNGSGLKEASEAPEYYAI
jgi:hypothetical protein